MATDGDTIVYSATSSSSPVKEDISTIDEITIDYLDGAGGETVSGNAGGSGGRVANVTVDVSAHNTLYIWIAGTDYDTSRYHGQLAAGYGGASSEIALVDTDQNDSSDEPFLVGAGGGGSGGDFSSGGDAARGGNAQGSPPPAGGAGGSSNSPGNDGEGAIDSRAIISGGTTTTGGGAAEDTGGEAQISYTNLAPTAPSNLSATLK